MLNHINETTHPSPGMAGFQIYRAWVPTQGGYLHFSRLADPSPNGRKRPDAGFWEQSAGKERRRYVALHQRRVSQDSPLANLFWGSIRPWANRWLLGDDGRWECVCLCWHKTGQSWCREAKDPSHVVTDAQPLEGMVSLNLEQSMHGRLFLFEPKGWKRAHAGSKVPPRQAFWDHLDRVRKQAPPGQLYAGEALREDFWGVVQELSRTAYIYMDFVLERDGSTTLIWDGGNAPLRSLRFPCSVKAWRWIRQFPSKVWRWIRRVSSVNMAAESPADVRQIVTDQADRLFNFLKDIAHEHIHHSPSADSFLKVHPIAEGAGDVPVAVVADSDLPEEEGGLFNGVLGIPVQQDARWRQETLRGLYEVVNNRIPVITSYESLKGFLCFTMAFENICQRCHPKLKSPADANLLKESLDASTEERESKAQGKFRSIVKLFQWLTILAGIFSLLDLLPTATNTGGALPNPSLIKTYLLSPLLESARLYPDVAFPVCVILFWWLYAMAGNPSIKSESTANVARILNALSKPRSAIAILLLVGLPLALFLLVTQGYLALMAWLP
jgi:hypothetical protein